MHQDNVFAWKCLIYFTDQVQSTIKRPVALERRKNKQVVNCGILLTSGRPNKTEKNNMKGKIEENPNPQ